jgi:methyl-coenzyme M reductase subunit D
MIPAFNLLVGNIMIEIEVFPHRFLKADTTEKFLNEMYSLETVERVIIHGQPLPKTVYYGPARGTPVNHPERKEVLVRGVPVELTVMAGRFWILLNEDNELNKIEEVCKSLFPYGYNLNAGKFTRSSPTTTDYMKYGEKLVNSMDRKMIGLTDPRSKFTSSVKMIPKNENAECEQN